MKKSHPILILLLLVLFLLLCCTLAYVGVNRIERHIRYQAVQRLESVASLVQKNTQHWQSDLMYYARKWAEIPLLQRLTLQQLNKPRNTEAMLAGDETSQIRSLFEEKLQEQGDSGIFVIAPDFITIFSMRDENTGTQNIISKESPALLSRVFEGETIMIPPILSDVSLEKQKIHGEALHKVTMFVATPIRDDNGNVIAAFCVRIDPIRNLSTLAETGRFGSSGETYFFNRKGEMITRSRFEEMLISSGAIASEETSILSVPIVDPELCSGQMHRNGACEIEEHFTVAICNALQGIDGQRETGFRDYRGVPVLGAWKWIDSLALGLTTEIDEEEVMLEFVNARNWLLMTFALMALLALLLLLIITLLRKHYIEELIMAQKEAQDANALKDKFVFLVSHDLKSPLSTIESITELLDGESLSEEDNHRLLCQIGPIATNMRRLIDDILNMSRFRLNAKKVSPEQIKARQLVSEIVAGFTHLLSVKHLELVYDVAEGALLYGDRTLLKEVVKNLISNAIKFSHPHTSICLDIVTGQTHSIITVADEGVGISSRSEENIFAMEKTTSTIGTAGETGTGFGLPLSKEIIAAHGGTIELLHNEGPGTTFRITIPYEAE